jgi:hypothetical protein
MKYALKILVINMAILLVLLLLLEFVLSVVDFKKNNVEQIIKPGIRYSRRLHSPFNDGVNFPDKNHLKHADGLKAEPFRFVTNQDGLILGPAQYDKGILEECDILFFGGSTTECLYVHDSLRFPYLVGKMLTEALNKPVATLNAGHAGNNILHSLTNLIYTGLAYKPKTVVLMHAINDLALLSKTGSYFITPTGARSLIVRMEPSKIKKTKFHSFLISQYFPFTYRLFKKSIAKRVKASASETDEFYGLRGTSVSEAVVLDEYEKALESFYQICRAYQIELVLMTQFNRLNRENAEYLNQSESRKYQIELAKWIPTYIKMNEVVRNFAREKGLVLIDLDREIPPNSRHIYDEVHLNNKGSVLAGQIITRHFLKNQLAD